MIREFDRILPNKRALFANKISSKFNPMGNQKNQISLIGKNREENWKKMTKGEVGEKIIKEISTYFN